MSNISRVSLLILIIFITIASIVVSSNRQHGNLNQNNNVQTAKIVQQNSSVEIEKEVESSPKNSPMEKKVESSPTPKIRDILN